MGRYDDAFNDFNAIAPGLASINQDENPDDGARAMQLSRATNVPAPMVYEDLDGFENAHRRALSTSIIQNSPHLAAYLRSNPLASVISNDDYGNLDAFAKGVPSGEAIESNIYARHIKPLVEAAQGAYEGAVAGYASPPDQKAYEEYITKNKWWQIGDRVGYNAIDFGRRINDAAMGLVQGGAEGLGKGLASVYGLDQDKAAQFADDLLMSEGMRGAAPEHAAKALHLSQDLELYRKIKLFRDAGMEVPRGIDPRVDAAKADLNAHVLDLIEKNLKQANASFTKLRDAPSLEEFANQEGLYGDSTLSIDGRLVAQLYGDKVPEATDGLLGWAPRMAEQVQAARDFGADVHIPMTEMMANIDPAVFRTLRDGVRVWDGGITALEKAEKIEAQPTVDGALPQFRGAAGLEPMFGIGDKKLTLERQPDITPDFHEYNFLDQDGKPVGSISIMPNAAKKELYVGDIGGLAGLYSNSFGPALMLDLKRQLKALYPDAEWITGHRVSGAREAADATEGPSAHPRIRLGVEPNESQFRELLEDQSRTSFGIGLSANVLDTDLLRPRAAEVANAAVAEVSRITGQTPTIVSDIHYEGRPDANIQGVHLHGRDLDGNLISRMLVNLYSDDPIGFGRHESIHYLRRHGLINDREWAALVKASRDEGWIEKYNIEQSYPDLDGDEKHEEAIAEAFRDWANAKDMGIEQPVTPVTSFFEKLRQMIHGFRQRLADIFGREPTPEELFEKVFSGEVGQRAEGRVGPDAKARFAIQDNHLENLRASGMGLDLPTYRRLAKALRANHEADLKASEERALKVQAAKQTKEWKAKEDAIRDEIKDSIARRPDVAADQFIGTGKFLGQDTGRARYYLRADDIPDQFKGLLPRHYPAKDGVPVDAMARLFGYPSGEEFLAHLAALHSSTSGLTSNERLAKVTSDEVSRRMAELHGSLDQNILLDAKDQALSENNLNYIAEEMMAAAMKAGQAVDKNLVQQRAYGDLAVKAMGEISSKASTTAAFSAYRRAVQAMAKGDVGLALRELQSRYYHALQAAEATKYEKALTQFEKAAKRYGKHEVPSVEPEWHNQMIGVYQRIGVKTQRSADDNLREIKAQASPEGLAEFVAQKVKEVRNVYLSDELADPSWQKTLKAMTAEEFEGVNNTVKSLLHNGRLDKKINLAGAAEDFEEFKQSLKDKLSDSKGGEARPPQAISKLKQIFVRGLQMENIAARFDRWDKNGPWSRLIRNMAAGANDLDAKLKDYGKRISDLATPKDLDRTIENSVFNHQDTDTPLPMTRRNLLAVMLNVGSNVGAKSNLAKLARGYKVKPTEIMDWVNRHATQEDWEFVQGVGKIFADLKAEADQMYRHTAGVAPKNIPLGKVRTAFGEVDGWYFPLVYDKEQVQSAKALSGGDVLESSHVSAVPPNGSVQERTGYAGPISLSLDHIPTRMGQMLQDIVMRPSVIETAKVFRAKDVMSAVQKFYGTEYRQELMPYLRAVANNANMMSESQRAMGSLSEFIRQNLITDLVGLGLGTALKHGPTALGLSAYEVGGVNFGRAVATMFTKSPETAESYWQFAIRNSQELQRRVQHWQETLYGSGAIYAGPWAQSGLAGKFAPWRQRVMEWSSKPVAMSDMFSAVPTWLAAYEKAFAETGEHGKAVEMADLAVRRAHGSTAITNRTAFQRDMNPWFTSVYTFFSDIMNRQVETIWRAGDALGKAKEGDKTAGLKAAKIFTGGMMAYVIWPAMVEWMVSGEKPSEDEDWTSYAKTALGATAHTVGGGWPIARDVVNAIISGKDPQAGMLGTAARPITDIIRDLGKDDPFAQEHYGKLIEHGANLMGVMAGLPGAQAGRTGKFLYNTAVGEDQPEDPWDYIAGIWHGVSSKTSPLERGAAKLISGKEQ